MKRILLLTLTLFFTCITISGCSLNNFVNDAELIEATDEELIEVRIDSFVTAYNNGDINAVLECFDTKTRNTYKLAMSFTENIGGAFLKDITGLGIDVSLSDLFGFSVGIISDDDLLSAEISNINISDEENAAVDVTLSYKDMQSELSEDCTFIMLKEDGDWFIKDLESK